MTNTRTLHRRVGAVLLGLLAGCAAEVGAPSGTGSSAPLQGVEAQLPEELADFVDLRREPLATIELGPTHEVVFKQLDTGELLLLERYDMDLDTPALQPDAVEVGTMHLVYERLAGDAADPSITAILAAHDQDALAVPHDEAPDSAVESTATGPLPPLLGPEADTLYKSSTDDWRAWARYACNFEGTVTGCLGFEGQPLDIQPAGMPVCTNRPEICSGGNVLAGPWTIRRKSKNMASAAGNFDFNFIGAYKITLPNPCENDGGHKLCTKGGLIHYEQLQPRTVSQIWSSTGNSSRWTRDYAISGSRFMTIMINI